MEVEEEWSAIASPYGAEAERLGFRFVERSIHGGIPPSPETTFLCIDFHFDGAHTFLDIDGVLARGRHDRKLLIGLNGIQIYTFLRTPDIALVLTNGSPPNATQRLRRMRWNPLFRLAAALIPEDHRGVPMRGPGDLALVVARHRQLVEKRGSQPIEVTGPPLEFRWRIMEESEKSGIRD